MTLSALTEGQELLWLFSGLTPSWHRSGEPGGEGRDVQCQAVLLSQAAWGSSSGGPGSRLCLLSASLSDTLIGAAATRANDKAGRPMAD